MIKSVYIHVPFCSSKCNYCSFVSYDTLTLKNIYIDRLISEITSLYKNEVLDTIYFGGGTPSLLSVNDFLQILKHLNFDEKTEITTEINPENADRKYFQELKEIGINRLSIGIQVFDNELLKLIGRRHTKEDSLKTIEFAQEVGFNNISVDLIYGLPRQTCDSFLESVEKVLDLDVQHVSLYGLKIEEGCKFYSNKPDFLPDNDVQADMYLKAIDMLTKADFNHYEISNFAKKGFESRHNLNYWNNEYYYGFGVAASGYEGDIRYTNQYNIEKYIQNPMSKDSIVELSDINKLEEEIFLGFRRLKGIDKGYINKKYSIDFDKKYKNILEKYIQSRHLAKTKDGYNLTTEGVLLSNNILSEFIED